MVFRNVFCTIVLAASALSGQTDHQSDSGALGAPALGYVLDREAKSLRLVVGVPGASALGSPVILPSTVEQATFSESNVLIQVGADRALWLLDASGVAKTLDTLHAAPDLAAISPTGAYAALYYKSTSSLVIADLRQNKPASTLDAPGELTSIAVADTGTLVLASVDGSELRLFSTTADPRTIGRFPHVTAMSFLRNASDAVFTESEENAVYRLVGNDSDFVAQPIATERDGVSDPQSIGLLPDGKSVLVVSGSGATVVLNADSGVAQAVNCPCTPSNPHPLFERQFALTDRSTGTIWMFDSDGNHQRFVFIPPSVARSE